MNQRLKELMLEAGYAAPEIAGRANKLAELIVKECGQWFNDHLVVEPDYGLPHRIERNRAVVVMMKEYNAHFGVEE